MDKRIKIMTIGNAMYDIFLEYMCMDLLSIHSVPQPQQFMLLQAGKKCELEEVIYRTGGGATNSAVSFARLGFDVSSFFKVGTDASGKAIIDELSENNICTDYVVYTDTMHTGTSFVIPYPSGDRTTLMHRGANTTLTQAELPFAAIENQDYLYVTSLSGPAAPFIELITAHAKHHNKPVAVNPGTSQLVAGAEYLCNALLHIDILILNCYEASLLMHEFIPHTHATDTHFAEGAHLPRLLQMSLIEIQPALNIRLFFKEVIARGPRIVVVTNGDEGVYIARENMIYFHPSLDVNVVSTLGAGDAFGSCFVAQIAQGKPLEHAIRCGLANASSVIQYTDTKTGLLSTCDLEKYVQSIDQNLLQIFDF